MKNLIIGTRGSNLALAQAEHIKSRLEKMGLEIELKIIKTSGDINQSTFNEIPLKKLFNTIHPCFLNKYPLYNQDSTGQFYSSYSTILHEYFFYIKTTKIIL